MTNLEGFAGYVEDLESRPFQELRNVPVGGLQVWLEYNEDRGDNMGPEMRKLLGEYIQLRLRQRAAESRVWEVRKSKGMLAAALLGIRLRKELKIKHQLH